MVISVLIFHYDKLNNTEIFLRNDILKDFKISLGRKKIGICIKRFPKRKLKVLWQKV